jgi:hypothetical protein
MHRHTRRPWFGRWSLVIMLSLVSLTATPQPMAAAEQDKEPTSMCPERPGKEVFGNLACLAVEAVHRDFTTVTGHLLTVVGGVGVLGFWGASLLAYNDRKRWDRVNFAREQIKAFNDDPEVQLVLKLLDTNRIITTLPGKDDRLYTITDDLVIEALMPHEDGRYSHTEMSIRFAFDAFFEQFEHLSHMVTTGLIRRNDLYPYLHYWLNVLTGGRRLQRGQRSELTSANNTFISKSEAWRQAVAGYMDGWGYATCRQFIESYGHQLPPALSQARARE